MLGKTNITAVKGGTIVSDITEYTWDAVSTNVNSAFKTCFYGSNTLVGITADGQILYTKDGENWETADLRMDVPYKIMDGLWDGRQFVFVGSHDEAEANRCSGLIVTTDDFSGYDIMANCTGAEYSKDNTAYGINDTSIRKAYAGVFYAVMLNDDATYTVLSSVQSNEEYSSGRGHQYYLYLATGKLNELKYTCSVIENAVYGHDSGKGLLEQVYVETAKKSDSFLFYIQYQVKESSSGQFKYIVGVSSNGNTYIPLEEQSGSSAADDRDYTVFECKDSLYYALIGGKKLARMRGPFGSGKTDISIEIDETFISAVYFNKCEIFITAHQMLAVKQGENITDKMQDDLVDITYDFSITSIIKAFNKLYILGTGGNVLVSNNEVKNEEALAVRTMSASRALFEANKHTDEKYAELEGRIAALENRIQPELE